MMQIYLITRVSMNQLLERIRLEDGMGFPVVPTLLALPQAKFRSPWISAI
jgi:hypothetical protein